MDTYVICEADSTNALAQEVNERLRQGYALAGGVSVIEGEGHDGKYWYFFQAMILRTEAETP